MPGFSPIGSFPVASIPGGGPLAYSQSSRRRVVWRVKNTIRPISRGGVRRSTIQRSVVLYGIRMPPCTQPFVYVSTAQPQLPNRKLQTARQRFIITYRVMHKPWRPPHRFARPYRAFSSPPVRVTWFGLEALHDGQAAARVTWFGLEALHDGQAAARVSWLGIEVLRTITAAPVPTSRVLQARRQRFVATYRLWHRPWGPRHRRPRSILQVANEPQISILW